jgi:hypothetical protein
MEGLIVKNRALLMVSLLLALTLVCNDTLQASIVGSDRAEFPPLTGCQGADPVFMFSFFDLGTGGSLFSGSVTLTADDLGNGLFKATSGLGTVTFNKDTAAPTTVTLTLVPATDTGRNTSPTGSFWYDNYLTLSGTSLLQYDGLLFSTTLGSAPEINIWGNPNNAPYSFYTSDNFRHYPIENNDASFSLVSGVPEPATIIIWSLLGAGWAGLAVVRRRMGSRQPWSPEARTAIVAMIERGRK